MRRSLRQLLEREWRRLYTQELQRLSQAGGHDPRPGLQEPHATGKTVRIVTREVKHPGNPSALVMDHFHFDIEWNYRPVSASTDGARTSSGTPGTSRETSGPSDTPSGPGNGTSDGQDGGSNGAANGRGRMAGRTRRTPQETSPAGNGSSSESFPDWLKPRSELCCQYATSQYPKHMPIRTAGMLRVRESKLVVDTLATLNGEFEHEGYTSPRHPGNLAPLVMDHFHFDIEWNYRPVSASTDGARTSSGTPGTSRETSGPSDTPSRPR
ncbi:uncharacterized protein LOC122249339 [Penaeus japonicus]|uniref:uncharacterized protein LOC122249339 n=1 Tax=Penaeus japonicus TaxID=27405 RepID=UPI001C7166CD|nr:uncharacterized protein LOC122249339 [Penaeus japonicus]